MKRIAVAALIFCSSMFLFWYGGADLLQRTPDNAIFLLAAGWVSFLIGMIVE